MLILLPLGFQEFPKSSAIKHSRNPTLVKSGSSLNIPVQKRKLKRLVPIFSEELRAVLQHHHLLLPAAGSAKITSRFSNSPMARGFKVLRYHMIRTDVLGICRIAFDQNGWVSALTLIEQLLNPEAEGLRESFKADYSRPSPIPASCSCSIPGSWGLGVSECWSVPVLQ